MFRRLVTLSPEAFKRSLLSVLCVVVSLTHTLTFAQPFQKALSKQLLSNAPFTGSLHKPTPLGGLLMQMNGLGKVTLGLISVPS